MVNILLHHGVKVDQKDNLGQTPLMVASSAGYIKLVKILLSDDGGAKINEKAENGATSLIGASDFGQKEIVKLLIEKGAVIHSDDDQSLILASQNGHEETVKILIDSDEPENFVGINKFSKELQDEIITRLEKEAKKEGKSALTLASEASNLGLVQLLLDQ